MRTAINADAMRDQALPLYHKYPTQTDAQPAYLEILPDERRALAGWSGEIGNGVPLAVWHGRHLRTTLPNRIRGEVLAGWLENDEVQALLARVCDGHTTVWDGRNHVGRLTDDAREALETLDELGREMEQEGRDTLAQVWDPGDWLSPDLSLRSDRVTIGDVPGGEALRITRATTDDELAAMAEKLKQEAATDEIHFSSPLIDYLRTLRDDLEDEEDA